MKKQECPVCGNYAILLKDQKMCWDCYIKNCTFKSMGFGGEE